jgi:hypothetical protein
MMINIPSVNHTQLKYILQKALETKKSVLVLGKYGIGKTGSVYQFAKERNMGIVDVKLSQFDAVTFRGIPSIVNGRTVWNIPKMMDELIRGNAVLLLDEFDKSQPSVASASYELLLQRKYGDWRLPDDVLIVATANFESDDFRSQGISVPQLDRVIKVELILDVNEWIEWAEKNKVDKRIVGFIRENPKLLWRDGNEESYTTTSPRSWATASDLISGVNDLSMIRVLVGSAVGLDMADLFVEYLKRSSMNFEKVYEDGDVEKIRELNVGEKKQFAMFLVQKLEKEPVKVFELLTKYLDETKDAESVVFMLRELKAEIGEDKFNSLFRSTTWRGKKEFIKELAEITKRMEGVKNE